MAGAQYAQLCPQLGFFVFQQDRSEESGKLRGGELCFMVNSSWPTEVCVQIMHCSPGLKLLTIKVKPLALGEVCKIVNGLSEIFEP